MSWLVASVGIMLKPLRSRYHGILLAEGPFTDSAHLIFLLSARVSRGQLSYKLLLFKTPYLRVLLLETSDEDT